MVNKPLYLVFLSSFMLFVWFISKVQIQNGKVIFVSYVECDMALRLINPELCQRPFYNCSFLQRRRWRLLLGAPWDPSRGPSYYFIMTSKSFISFWLLSRLSQITCLDLGRQAPHHHHHWDHHYVHHYHHFARFSQEKLGLIIEKHIERVLINQR